MFKRAFVGLDIRAQSLVAYALDTASGEVTRDRMNPDLVAVSGLDRKGLGSGVGGQRGWHQRVRLVPVLGRTWS